MANEIVFLNGEFMPAAEAKVPVLDRGFLFGDGVYEVIPVYGKVLFRLQEHLARLAYSLGEVRIRNPYAAARWAELLQGIVDRNPWPDQSVYLQVTRGVAPRDQAFPKPAPEPTVFMMAWPMRTPSREMREKGVGVVTREDFRWQRCDIKVISLIANCLLREESAAVGAAETLLVRDGHVTEASTSNAFIVRDGVIVSPPKDNRILPGITYDLVIELARASGLPLEVRPVPLPELWKADEVWLSSSTKEVLPVTSIDGKPVGSGKPGPVYERMYRLYQDYKAKVASGAHV